MEQFSLASMTEYPNNLAEDIFTRSRSSFLTLSLKLFPFESETLIQILVLDAWGTARMEFALKLRSGGVGNGPATNFFPTHKAIVSVTLDPCVNAIFELGTVHSGMQADWKAGAPDDKYSIHFFARFNSDISRRCLFFVDQLLKIGYDDLCFRLGWDRVGWKIFPERFGRI